MAIELIQSTASQEVPLGVFVDETDGKTAETGLTIANTDIKLWVTGATTLANKNSGGATHISGGIYYCVLDATDTATLGPLVIFVHVAGALPVRVECVVRASTGLPVNVTHFGGTAGTFSGGRPEVNTTHAAGTAWGSGAITAASIASDAITAAKIADNAIDAGAIASDAITAAKIASNAITAAKIATDAIGAAQLAADAVTEIQSGLSTLNAAGIRSAVGLASANLDTQLTAIDDLIDTEVAAIKTVVDAVQAKTDNLPSDPADASVVAGLIAAMETKVDTVDTVVDAIKAKTDNLPSDPADASVVAGLIAAAEAKIDAVQAKTDQLTFTKANELDANIQSVNDVTVNGDGQTGTEWGP